MSTTTPVTAQSQSDSEKTVALWPAWSPVFAEPPPHAGSLEVRHRGRPLILEVPLLVLAAFVIAFAVKSVFVQAFYIPSESMVPTLLKGDRVVVSRLAYRLHDPNRGDVVVFSSPYNIPHPGRSVPARLRDAFLQSFGLSQPKDEDFIKRVVGLPGETVDAHSGHLYVDGRELREPYLPPGVLTRDFPPILVPPHHLWLMGDNRDASSDSRFFGPVDEGKIVGRAIVRVWPPQRLAFL